MLHCYHLSLYHAKYAFFSLHHSFSALLLWYVVTPFRISKSSRLCAQTFSTSPKQKQKPTQDQHYLSSCPVICLNNQVELAESGGCFAHF